MPIFNETTVDQIRVIETRGPWVTKSGGSLNVLFALAKEEVESFLDYTNPEFDVVAAATGSDLRGLRSYAVRDIPMGSIGGQEWHRARTEYVHAVAGAVLWQCVDFAGNEAEYVLDGTSAVIIPPGILHTYKALRSDTSLVVVCNTLFDPQIPETHDTYSQATFYELQCSTH